MCKRKGSLCCNFFLSGQRWTFRVDFSPKPVPCPCLHLALSQRARSLYHWSAKASDAVRGDGGQTEVRQTVAIWESIVPCVPASPHHCRPCVRIKPSIFHFRLVVFSWETLEFTVCVMAHCSHETKQHNNKKSASFLLLSRSVKETSCSKIYEEKTQVIKVEDLPTRASASNMLLCGLRFLCSFHPLLPNKNIRWMMGQ